MKISISRLSVLLFFFSTSVFAQTGWDYIKQDDNISAKKAFLESLEKDSTDLQSLKGMIYLCDIEDNDLDYDKYANTLLIHHFDNNYFNVFEESSIWTGTEIIENTEIDKRFKLRYELGKALQLKRKRKFEEAQKLIVATINDFDWSYLGPFKNINGYGHIKQFDVEDDAFDTSKTYVNKDKFELKWLTPKYHYPIKTLDFSNILMKDNHGSTFYANTFFEVEKEEEIQITVTRKYPIKIWLDDVLVFDDDEFVAYNWEAEKVKLKLKKGNHRLMIKYSESNYFTGISKTYNNSIHEYGYKDYYNSNSSKYKSDDYISPYTGNDLVIRITDTKGETLPIKSSHENQVYEKVAAYEKEIKADESIQFFKEAILADTSDWFNYYMLSNTYFQYGLTKETEEYFVKELEQKEVTFFKFIMFQLYNVNGKKEKGFVALSGIDHDKTPVLSVLMKEIKEIDKNNQPKEYEAALLRMLEVTPSNRYAIRSLLNFYNAHGRVQDRIDYANNAILEFPSYKSWLEDYTKEDYKPSDRDIGKEETKKDPKQEFKEAKKDVKNEFVAYQYESLIKKYKSREKEDKVLELYDEYLSINNYSTVKRRGKAKYLFNLERYDDALVELNTLLAIDPYDDDTYELIGDIYNDQGKDTLALEYYLKADRLSGGGNSYYGSNGLSEKIAQIEGQKELKNKFKQYSFEDWEKDNSWRAKYRDEESVIIGFTSNIYLEDNGTVHKYAKMLIHVLTESGAKSWTEYNFNMIGSIQYIKVIKPNGTELFPDKNGSFVVFKNLQPGDLILFETEDSYTPNTELGSHLHNFEYLSLHAPINFAKVEVSIPNNLKLQYQHHKLEDNTVIEAKESQIHYSWEYENLPKQIQEEAIIDEMDTYTHIQYNTIENWSGVVEWYQAKTYRKLEINYELKNILDTIITEIMTDKEKVISIYNFITKEIAYSHTRLLQSGYIPKNTELTCSGKIGDCKDVATLMISMLRSQGIEAYYVLVKTNSMFHLKTLPSTYFDHVIAGVVLDGKMEYFDLTTDFYPYYVTNENDMNAWALLIKDDEESIFRLPNDFLNRDKNLVKHEITANVNLDKSIDIEVESEFHGMRGGRIRETYHNKPRADMENEILGILGKGVFKNVVLEDYQFKNPVEITAPFEASYKMKAKKHADNVLDIFFLTVPYMTGIETNTAILSEKRYNTLNLHEVTKIEPTLQEVYVSFPKGMKLYKLPENIHVESEWGIYDVKFERHNGGVKVTKFQKFNVAEVPVARFNDFKEFYLTLLEYDRTKIVFNGQ